MIQCTGDHRPGPQQKLAGQADTTKGKGKTKASMLQIGDSELLVRNVFDSLHKCICRGVILHFSIPDAVTSLSAKGIMQECG